MDIKSHKNKYPLTGFDKITFEEFLGIINLLNSFSKLPKEEQEIISLVIDGMKYRNQSENQDRNKLREG